jgi:GAF domain-containing protein
LRELISGVVLSGVFIVPTAIGQWLLRSGRVRLASLLLVGVLYLGFTYAVIDSGGVAAPVASTYILLITIAGLLLDKKIAILSVGLVVLTGIGFVYAESIAGWIEPRPTEPAYAWTTYGLVTVFVAILLYLANDSISRALGQARHLAGELRAHQNRLEATVQERTRTLERRSRYLGAIASIARDTALLTNVDGLLERAALLIGERFGFYHVGVYLADTSGEWAVLRAARGTEGQQLVSRGHRLRVGTGSLVGSVADGAGPQVVSDAPSEAAYLHNPDQPATRCALRAALPLRVRGEVLGVLDIQSTDPEAFGEEDLVTFQILADQVAMALGNALSFQQMEESLEAERRAYGVVTGAAWQELLHTRSALGFVRDRRGISPVGGAWRPELDEALRAGKVAVKEGAPSTVVVPIIARGQVIGVIDARKPEETGEWTEPEIDLLEVLRDQLGEAVESARLYEDVQRREARERVVGEISSRMRESLSLDAVLQTAIREIGEALDIDEVEVRMTGDVHSGGRLRRNGSGEAS